MNRDPVITPEVEQLFNIALTHHTHGSFDLAAQAYRKCIAAEPLLDLAWGNLGRCLAELRLHREAIEAYTEAFRLNPNSPEFLVHKSIALLALGDDSGARETLERALEVDPKHVNALNALGNLELRDKNAHAARALYERAMRVAFDPAHASSDLDRAITLNNMGAVCREQRLISQAAEYYTKALQISPYDPNTLSNLANVHLDMARQQSARSLFDEALRNGADATVFANALMALLYQSGVDPLLVRARHEQWAAQFVDADASPAPQHRPWRNERGEPRPLRIGYLSSDFREHVLFKFLYPVVSNHSSDVELFAYSNVRAEDSCTVLWRNLIPNFRNVTHLSDRDLDATIRRDELDVLIELNGHTEGNRLAALSRKPAPIICSWLGYPATTGCRFVDYRIVDRFTDPDAHQNHCTEKLLRLERGFNVYAPRVELPPICAAPCLTNGYVTFGSANTVRKLSEETVVGWSTLLLAAPSARLRLKAPSLDDDGVRAAVTEAFAAHGVTAERIDFAPFAPDELSHLQFYESIDIALDSFPYNGTTTTCDALSMGVPVLTLLGTSHVSRVSYSILERVGLSDFVARDRAHFVAIGTSLAANPSRISELRVSLRSRISESAIGKYRDFVAALERSLREVCGAA